MSFFGQNSTCNHLRPLNPVNVDCQYRSPLIGKKGVAIALVPFRNSSFALVGERRHSGTAKSNRPAIDHCHYGGTNCRATMHDQLLIKHITNWQ